MDCKPIVTGSIPVVASKMCPAGGTADTLRLGRSALIGMGVQISRGVPILTSNTLC